MIKQKLKQIISEAEGDRISAQGSRQLDKKSMVVLLLIPFCLSMVHYIGKYEKIRQFLLGINATQILDKMDLVFYTSNNLGSLAYWVCNIVVFYFIIPALTVKLVFKENLSDYGVKLKGAFKDFHLYLLILLVMFPLVFLVSHQASFLKSYPFLKLAPGDSLYPDFWKWEILYCLQFFALEFFFRGFVLFGLKAKLGFYSVFVMTIPYCMIHFGKPLPETLAAIVAGVVLACLSLKNKSILMGFLIHVSVGLLMDLLALWHKGFFD